MMLLSGSTVEKKDVEAGLAWCADNARQVADLLRVCAYLGARL